MAGKLQKRIRRAFIANPNAELTTGDLRHWCYPRLTGSKRNQRFAIRHAALEVAVPVRRGWKGSIVWRAREETFPPASQQPDAALKAPETRVKSTRARSRPLVRRT